MELLNLLQNHADLGNLIDDLGLELVDVTRG